MERHLRISTIYFLFYLLTAGCVSVRLSDDNSEKSNLAKWQSPPAAFKNIETKHLDQVWQHKNNGNTISYLSECNNRNDPSIENIQRGILSEISDQTKVESNEIDIAGRKGLHTIVDGKVDGILSRVELVIFKKHNCTYILTYTGVTAAYGNNQKDFLAFVKSFEVP